VWNGTAIITTYGGTGLASYTAGDMFYYASGTTLTKLAKGTADQVLTMNDGATAPGWEDAAAGGAALTGSTNNTIVTVTGADAMQGEANLGFTGTNLGIGVLDPDNFLEIKGGNNAYININHTGGAGGYQSGILFKTNDTQNYKIDVTGNSDMTWRSGASETVTMTLASGGAVTVYEGGDAVSVQGGLAKAFVRFRDATLYSSWNVSSVTDYGVGDWMVNLTNGMGTADNHSIVCVPKSGDATTNCVIVRPNNDAFTATAMRLMGMRLTGAAADPSGGSSRGVCCVVYGVF
jgi:hypothetical protein